MRAFDRRRRALASALILLCLTLPALAQSTLTGPLSKPYTLRIHYATAAEPGTDTAASNKPKARRIELTVAAIDAGTVTTRDATLDYRFEASPDSAQITLVLELAALVVMVVVLMVVVLVIVSQDLMQPIIPAEAVVEVQ